MICKIEWHEGEMFPRIGLIVTNSRLSAVKVVKVYNGRAEIENRIKEGKNTLRWEKATGGFPLGMIFPVSRRRPLFSLTCSYERE